VTILSEEYELWLSIDPTGSQTEFLSRLSLDLFSVSYGEPKIDPQQRRNLRLIWHYEPRQLQRIEELRRGNPPNFQIRNSLRLISKWLKTDGTPPAEPVIVEERAFGEPSNSYPAPVNLDHAKWIQLLDEIGFRQIILHELPIPTFPLEFGRAENHLKAAWNHHRAGREDAALMSCFKTFECLGYSISGAQMVRTDVLAHLMNGQEEAKREKIQDLWKSLSEYCHLGRHDKGAPVRLTNEDGELAVVSTTILLKYLASTLTSVTP
jgi:hypothetical protein